MFEFIDTDRLVGPLVVVNPFPFFEVNFIEFSAAFESFAYKTSSRTEVYYLESPTIKADDSLETIGVIDGILGY